MTTVTSVTTFTGDLNIDKPQRIESNISKEKNIKIFERSLSLVSLSKHVQSKRDVTMIQNLFDFVNSLANLLAVLYLLIAV